MSAEDRRTDVTDGTDSTTGAAARTLDAEQAAAALAEVHRRGDQTRAAATAPWPAAGVVGVAAAFLPLGYLLDMDLVWAYAAAVGLLTVTVGRRAVRLRGTDRDLRRDLLLVGSFLLAVVADVAVQAVVRTADLPLPNTWGAAAAAVVVLTVSWPLQRRTAHAAGGTA